MWRDEKSPETNGNIARVAKTPSVQQHSIQGEISYESHFANAM